MTEENSADTEMEQSLKEGRSIFTLSSEELEEMIASESFLDGVNLMGIEEQDNFDKLMRYRNNPKMLAQIVLKKRLGQRVLAEPISVKEKRLAIREIEAQLKASKQESAMFYQKEILKLLKDIKLQNEIILRHVLKGGVK
jgi:hypothetical protein